MSVAAAFRSAAILATLVILVFAREAGAAGRPPTLLQGCTIDAPDLAPLFPKPAAAAVKAATQGDEDETDQDADDDDSDTTHGFASPGSGTCIAVSGTVNTGLQRDGYKVNALTRATGLAAANATSFPLSASVRIETGEMLANGLHLASAFAFSYDTGSDPSAGVTLEEASITLGPLAFGVASSRFDFWSGDEFALIGRIPSRTVGIIGYERPLTETISLSLSAEDPSIDKRTPVVAAGRNLPDGILRLQYQHDGLTLHGAVALRDVPRLGGSSLLGRAGILGATWEGSLLKRPLTLSAQIAGAVNAAPYIGSRLDRRTISPLLTGDESTRGWSGIVSIGREWTDEWSTNAYLSRYSLSVSAAAGTGGQIEINAGVANIVWKPIEGLRLGLEAAIAWQRIDLAGRTLAASLNGRRSSAQLFIERSF